MKAVKLMSKLDELIQEYCPDGVEYKKLGECCVISAGGDIPKNRFSKNCTEEYRVPIISNGIGKNAIYGYTDSPKITNDAVTISARGTIGYAEYRDYPFYPIVRLLSLIPDNKCLNPKFLYYVLQGRKYNVPETGIPQLTAPCIKKELIPLPPLPVQEEIVRILDNFTELTENLNIELTARKKQYEYYRDKLLTFDVLPGGTNAVKQMAVGDVATVTKLAGFEFTKYVTYSDTGKVIALRGLNVKNGRLDLTNVKYIDNSDLSKLSRSKLYIGDMLFTYVGTIGQVALISENDKYYLAPNVALIRCDKNTILPEYMLYYFQSNYFISKQINKYLQSSSMQNLTMENIRKFEICIPPLETQKRIVHVLDNFEKICSDLNIGLPAEIEARQKQYEYYRDSLLTFAAKGDIIVNRTEQNRTPV